MGYGLHPFIQAAIIGLFVGSVFLLIALVLWRKRGAVLPLALAVILLIPSGLIIFVLMPELFDPRYQTFRRLYHDIDEGMSRVEVMELVDSLYPSDGERIRPRIDDYSGMGLHFYMDRENGRGPNAEAIHLHMASEGVAQKSYSWD